MAKRTGINQKEFSAANSVEAKWAVETFNKEDDSWDGEQQRETHKLMREQFVHDFPVAKIKTLTIEQFADGEESFCYRIRRKLQCLASMGNAWPDTFGKKKKKGSKEICLSSTYKKMFDSDVSKAFEYIKDEIFTLLHEFPEKKFSVVERLHLNQMFTYKLILIYYPEDTFSVCAHGALKKYCHYFGLSYSDRDEMYVGIQTITKWKNKCSCLSDWSSEKLMWFAGWLIQSDYSIDGSELEDENIYDINITMKPSGVVHDRDGAIRYICGNCGGKFRVAHRCPECGQLVQDNE